MSDRKSEAIIDSISFVDLQPLDINPLISTCNIKVCYVGQNRNNSYIDKETLVEMSKTIRGCPIVGWYSKDKGDFVDHGDQMIIDGNGVHFNSLTRPYGFIDINSKVWFQFFEDTDEFGNTCLREYLVVQGYLWTGQYPEADQALKNENPQSMELDEESLKGHWATDNNSGIEFFIINDAIFSKLCILGENVEPCFEGAQIVDPEINSVFSNNSGFIKDFVTTIRELNYALKTNKGGLSMDGENKTAPVAEESKEVIENSFQNQNENNTDLESYKKKDDENKNNQNPTEDENKNKDDDNKEDQNSKSGSEEDKNNDNDNEKNNDKDEEKKQKPSTKNNLEDISKLQSALSDLQEKFALLENENKELLNFKNQVENEEKDKLIKSFYMLSDEDKKQVIENKANYSLEDIKKELSVICFDKKVNFNLEDNKKNDDDNTAAAPTIFNINAHQADNLPAWLKAVENVKNRNN